MRWPISIPSVLWSAVVGVVVVAVCAAVAGCSSTHHDTTRTGWMRTGCPSRPLRVVVSIGQWSDLVQTLVGDCGDVVTLVPGTAGDPHDHEATPSDAAAVDRADLVVANGLGYDAWASSLLHSSSHRVDVVEAARVAGARPGSNPHLWYDPAVVERMGADVERVLVRRLPNARSVLEKGRAAWQVSMRRYLAAVARTKGVVARHRYVASESVFERMGVALGMLDATPPGYASATANGSEPGPGDVFDFEQVLRRDRPSVLVVNPQTSGALPGSMRTVAIRLGVPIVEFRETEPAHTRFVDWQIGQLDALAGALR